MLGRKCCLQKAVMFFKIKNNTDHEEGWEVIEYLKDDKLNKKSIIFASYNFIFSHIIYIYICNIIFNS